jgi:hypothetical protein
VVLLYAFLIGCVVNASKTKKADPILLRFFIAHSLGTSCLSAGVSTIFVGLAEEVKFLYEESEHKLTFDFKAPSPRAKVASSIRGHTPHLPSSPYARLSIP